MKEKMAEEQQENYFGDGGWELVKDVRRFSHQAMAAIFEIIIQNDDERYARQAAQAAFAEVDRIETELSCFIENSDISRINNVSGGERLRIGLDAFECLKLSKKIFEQTAGAFDVTIGPLFTCWQNKDGTIRNPSEQELSSAQQRVGMDHLILNKDDYTVELMTSPMQIDLGGIGKGYALDCMAEMLKEWSIETVLIHGGFSSVLALNAPTGSEGWNLTLSNPSDRKEILSRVYLRRRALGGSGLQKGSHIIDPRTARPVARPEPGRRKGRLAAWSCASNAATADALSTAFMIMEPKEIERYCSEHSEVLAMVLLADGSSGQGKLLRFGRWRELGLIA